MAVRIEHTPGPWKAESLGSCNSISIVAQDGTRLAEIINDDDICVTPIMLANGQAMAAAPELLVALKQAEAFVLVWAASYQHQRGLKDFHEQHQETLNLTRAAIEKAEGRA